MLYVIIIIYVDNKFSVIVGQMVKLNLKEVGEQLKGEKFDIFLKSMTKLLKKIENFTVGNGSKLIFKKFLICVLISLELRAAQSISYVSKKLFYVVMKQP